MPNSTQLSFELELKQFHERAIRGWHDQHDKLVGVSIQIGDTSRQNSQNCMTVTRDDSTHLVNPFCRTVLQSDLDKCDSLDQILKRRANLFYQSNPEHDHTCLGCRCHRGVSNFLLPYYYSGDKQTPPTRWYVFIGQFLLLKPETKHQTLASAEFDRMKIVDVLQHTGGLEIDETGLIQQDAFIGSRNGPEKALRTSGISKLTWTEFLQFHQYILGRFEEFLRPYFKDGKPVPALVEDIFREEREIDGLALQAVILLEEFIAKARLDTQSVAAIDQLQDELGWLKEFSRLQQDQSWRDWFNNFNTQLREFINANAWVSSDTVNTMVAWLQEARQQSQLAC